MRRRQVEDPLADVPPELVTFDVHTWRRFVEDVDEPLARDLRAVTVWTDARTRYAAEHGWPGSALERIREQRQARMDVYRDHVDRRDRPGVGTEGTVR